MTTGTVERAATAGPTPSDEDLGGAGRARRWLQATVLGVPLALFAVGGWVWRWIVDDGFIYLRVVDQVTSGNGPVFNAGERVEVFTSPLWLLVLTIGDVVTPVRLEWLAVLLGVALSTLGLGLATAGASRLARRAEHDAFLAPFGVLVLVALVPMWIFQTSGLETGLVFAWLGACVFVLARWAATDEPLPWHGAVLVGLGWLVRPELALMSALFLLTVLLGGWRDDDRASRARLVGAAVALPVLYQVFRMGYYGSLVSNPAIAKEASSTNPERGWDYLVDFVSPYWLWLPLVLLAVGGYLPMAATLRRAGASRALLVAGALALAGLLHAGYIVLVGGDWIHARLLLPGLFVLVAPVAVVPLTRRYAAAALLVPWALVAAVVLRPSQLDPDAPITQQFVLGNVRDAPVEIDDIGWAEDGPRRRWYEGAGYYFTEGFSSLGGLQQAEVDLTEDLEGEAVAAVGGIGIIGYAIGPELHVVDLLGLANPLNAHMETSPSRGVFERKPGHEKPLPSVWLAAMITSDGAEVVAEDFPDQTNPLIAPTTGAEFREQVAWARATLGCPDLRELLDSVREPLGPGRFLDNLVGSLARTRLRVPPDPQEAYRQLCGPGTPEEVRSLRSAPDA